MKKFVVYQNDYENHKDLVVVLSERNEAQLLCDVLNDKCANAVGMDYDEIIEFAEQNKLRIEKRMILNVSGLGSYFKFEEVEYQYTMDYSIFNADWDETNYDWYTSDNHPGLFDEYDWDEHYFDYDLGVYDNVDVSRINRSKLKEFNTGDNTYKRFKPKFAHPDVAHNFAWYDPIHDFSNNKGFRNGLNKIERMIAKHVRNGGCMAKDLVDKIKGCDEYKHSHTFRNVAKDYINALENPIGYEYSSNWEWKMGNYIYQNGCVMNKQDARKYWGYEEICDICGKDHGALEK